VDARVREFLTRLPPDVRGVAGALRAVVRKVVPDAEESMLWRGLSFHRPHIGGRVKGAVCSIAAKSGLVRLEFIHGARLRDPSGLLKGDGVSKRYVPIETIAVAESAQIEALIREAGTLNPARWRPLRRPKR